jgi:hypothetical protein
VVVDDEDAAGSGSGRGHVVMVGSAQVRSAASRRHECEPIYRVGK